MQPPKRGEYRGDAKMLLKCYKNVDECMIYNNIKEIKLKNLNSNYKLSLISTLEVLYVIFDKCGEFEDFRL